MPTLPAVKEYKTSAGATIYRIACQVLPSLNGYVHLILGAGPPTLIDAGSGRDKSTRQVLAGLEKVRTEFGQPVRLRDIERIILTHGHLDHAGGVGELVRKTHAKVGIHALDSRVLTAGEEQDALNAVTRRRFLEQAGVTPKRAAKLINKFDMAIERSGDVNVDFMPEDGQRLDGLQFFHTPGHSPGHLVVAVDNILLAGDHILPRTMPQQWPESAALCTGLSHHLDSLDAVENMGGFDLAMGGHESVMRDVYGRIDEIRRCHLRRLERVIDILRNADEPPTIAEIARRMYFHAKGFYAFLALCDVGARIEYLSCRGEISVANLDDVRSQPNPPLRFMAN